MSEAQDPVLRGDQMLASGGEWRREIWHTQGVFRRKRVEKGDLSTESAPSAGERVGTDTRPRPTALSGKCQLSCALIILSVTALENVTLGLALGIPS